MNFKERLAALGMMAGKASRAAWSFLTLSLADNLLAFARVVCISVETTGIHMVYGVRISTAVSVRAVRSVSAEDGTRPTPEFVAQAVSRFVADQKIAAAEFVMCVPREWALLQTARFPGTVKEYLTSVVYNEFDRLTPLSPANALYDFNVMEEDPSKLTLLIAAVKREVIGPYLEALQNRKIPVVRVTVGTLAIGHLIGRVYRNPNSIFAAAGETSYECGTVINHFPVRSAYGAVVSWDEASVDELAGKMRRQSDALVQKGCPSRMVVWAEGDLYARLQKRFTDIPVFHLNKDLKTDGLPNGAAVSAAALGGFLEAVGANPRSFNLLAGGAEKTRRKPLGLTVLLAAAILFICAFYYIAPITIEQNKVDELEARLQALKPEIAKIERLQKEAELLASDIKTINDFKKQSVLTVDVFKELTTTVPEKTWLTRIKVTDSTVEMEGYAVKATEIIPRLEASRLFQRAEFVSPTFRDQRTNSDRFFIKTELRSKRAETKTAAQGDKYGKAK
ncbi:MAG: hypothetical protein EG826_00910 [Deltaproteobacteria bacterium]|nr:hypothetical protein [Deltaproteobacteria bacterium]